MAVKSYRQLEVWKVAMGLAEQCYRTTKCFPKEELFGMTSQIRRAAVSVPANIAEGQGRQHTREFLSFLGIARGSLMELETHLILSHHVGLLNETQVTELLGLSERVSQMISGLQRALRRKVE